LANTKVFTQNILLFTLVFFFKKWQELCLSIKIGKRGVYIQAASSRPLGAKTSNLTLGFYWMPTFLMAVLNNRSCNSSLNFLSPSSTSNSKKEKT